MATSTGRDALRVQAQRDIPHDDVRYARDKVAAAIRFAGKPVLHARVRLSRLGDPALARPALVQANVDVDGRLVRAQVARASMREAVDEAHDRLRDQLQRAAGNWEAIRGGRPRAGPHEWRHGSIPTHRPPHFPREPETRQVVRHKVFSLSRMTLDEAAFDMDMLDYDFHLFTEDGSGVDSVLYRTDGLMPFRLVQARPRPDRVHFGATPVTVSAAPAPVLDTDQAARRLEVTGWPFVFFRDAGTGHACVIYHRYDGHYGVITQAADEPAPSGQ